MVVYSRGVQIGVTSKPAVRRIEVTHGDLTTRVLRVRLQVAPFGRDVVVDDAPRTKQKPTWYEPRRQSC